MTSALTFSIGAVCDEDNNSIDIVFGGDIEAAGACIVGQRDVETEPIAVVMIGDRRRLQWI